MRCPQCNTPFKLHQVKDLYGRKFKDYRCEKGHKREIVKDSNIVMIRDYLLNHTTNKRIYL